MDALNMEFESDSFDVVIDKGTLDALCCGSDYSMAEELLSEMLRVCKQGGTIWLITNSSGSNRRCIFQKCFQKGQVEIFYYKQFLSESVNLINILRSVGDGLSLKQVMASPQLMQKVNLKCKISSKIH